MMNVSNAPERHSRKTVAIAMILEGIASTCPAAATQCVSSGLYLGVVCTPNVFHDSRLDPEDTKYELLGMLVRFDAEVESRKAGTLTLERL